MQTFDTCATEEEAVAYIHPLIEILDQMRPGWPNAVDLTRLNLFASLDDGVHSACVFAQLFGSWDDGKLAVWEFVQENGLDIEYERISRSTAAFRGTVQHRAWEHVIRERQVA